MLASLPVAWISHPACARHQIAPGHPESPQRLAAIEDRMLSSGLGDFMQRLSAPAASREALLRVHDAVHIDDVLRHRNIGKATVTVDADTAYTEFTVEAALHAAGAGILGVDLLLEQRTELAFCAVRPPGHHAERGRAMGFCFFNNVAVAAAHALAHGLQRVAILDFDLHYGNGTADIFRDDPRVMLLSTYQHPLFPNWTASEPHSRRIDVPLPAYADGTAFRNAVITHWLPALERHRPEMLLVSAGFDAHVDDPLGDLRLRHDDFRWIGAMIRDVAAASAQNRVIATLEGGYDLPSLARSVEAFLMPFMGADSLPS